MVVDSFRRTAESPLRLSTTPGVLFVVLSMSISSSCPKGATKFPTRDSSGSKGLLAVEVDEYSVVSSTDMNTRPERLSIQTHRVTPLTARPIFDARAPYVVHARAKYQTGRIDVNPLDSSPLLRRTSSRGR